MDQMVQFADLSSSEISCETKLFSDDWLMKRISQWFDVWFGGYQVTLNPGEFDKATRPYNIGVNKQHSDGLKR